MTQNDFLRFAFEEAVNDLNPNSLQADVAKETLKSDESLRRKRRL